VTSAQKPALLFLTNVYNDSPEEDIYLTKQLRQWFDISIMHPLDCESVEDNFKIALIRNIWPSHEYEVRCRRSFIRDGSLRCYFHGQNAALHSLALGLSLHK